MRIVWTTSDSIASDAIKRATGADCSHVAIVFDRLGKVENSVFHSTLLDGACRVSFEKFAREYRVVHAIGLNRKITVDQERDLFARYLSRYQGEPYDYAAIAYWAYRATLYQCFNVALPKHNPLAIKHANLCTEMLKPICNLLDIHLGYDFEMVSPHDAFKIISKQLGR